MKNLQVYPNPAHNYFTIQTAQTTNNKIQLFNANRVLIKSLIVNNTISNIDITNLPAGIYLLRTDENLNSIKIIFQ
ncbi:MAG: T9SS type A sorting domain-containing protein [Bacteroidetes bacterium]|nr:T9SS type A sorting domain-containing protein [Bacteroidota bacterium]